MLMVFKNGCVDGTLWLPGICEQIKQSSLARQHWLATQARHSMSTTQLDAQAPQRHIPRLHAIQLSEGVRRVQKRSSTPKHLKL